MKIQKQTGSDNTYYASWDCSEACTYSSSKFYKGNSVKIKSSAKTYYNGASIPDSAKKTVYTISSISGTKATLNNGKVISTGNLAMYVAKSVDHYVVHWYYYTGDSEPFDGGSSNINGQNATYSPPENARKIMVRVKPVSKTHTVVTKDSKGKESSKEVSYWTGDTVKTTLKITTWAIPDTPSTPTVTFSGDTLHAKLTGITDSNTQRIQFQVMSLNENSKQINEATVVNNEVEMVWIARVGITYQVRCRAINANQNLYSEWSAWSSRDGMYIPATPAKPFCKALSSTSVVVSWYSVNNATSYTIEYTTDKNQFDNGDTTTKTGITLCSQIVNGLESGKEYFFRVKSVNSKNLESEWSEISSVIIGTTPSAPTTWSSTTTAMVGENVTLYWTHNSEDGSYQKSAEIKYYVNNETSPRTITIPGVSYGENEVEKTYQYTFDTTNYSSSSTIKWSVRTAGITGEYSEWSIERTFEIFAQPSLHFDVYNVSDYSVMYPEITTFPFKVKGSVDPISQKLLSCYITIAAVESYETVDEIGNQKKVNKNEILFSRYADIKDNNEFECEINANDVDLDNTRRYRLSLDVAMDSGLTTDAYDYYEVNWDEKSYDIDAEIGVDPDTLTAIIVPYCTEIQNELEVLPDDVVLSVYRRDYDGGFTEIAKNIPNKRETGVTDPHPSLNYARYRVVATSTSTGSVSYYDLPSVPVNEKSAVIQWDEVWSQFDSTNDDIPEDRQYTGSTIKLPFNIDFTNSTNPDVALVEYIGRNNPVSYYGTQKGETASFSADIVKDDEETIYALRRLQKWMGNVYFREPSGVGYYASVKVSFSQTHCETTIPVSVEITRVESGGDA